MRVDVVYVVSVSLSPRDSLSVIMVIHSSKTRSSISGMCFAVRPLSKTCSANHFSSTKQTRSHSLQILQSLRLMHDFLIMLPALLVLGLCFIP